ncbi:MAG: AraC family transcriptional regulator [Prevotella sp.]|nr:AraC family transcriptional regulator [Prevotella sp.]
MNTSNELEFVFSDDFQRINSPENRYSCVHLICLEGEGSLVFNDTCYHFCKHDLVVLSQPDKVYHLAAHHNLRVKYFAAPTRFLYSLLPSNNYAIGGRISLYQDPVIHLDESGARQFLDDISRLEQRAGETAHPFYREMMGSLCLTMIYDIFGFHSQQYGATGTTDRQAFVVKELMRILESGISKTEREVAYYAAQLHVSPKYLSDVIRRSTGNSVTFLIHRYTVPILQEYLNNEQYSLTQIADAMNFASLSYFSRYCTKHLGLSPSDYRKGLQPRK